MKEKVLKPTRYKKKGSPYYLVVAPNNKMNDKKVDTDWFLDITTHSNKSNEVKDCVTIIKSDLKGHMTMYFREGWEETDYVDILSEDVETKD